MNFQDYMTAKEAAVEIGISYQLLMARIRKKKIRVEKKGWATFIHKNEVKKHKRLQAEKNRLSTRSSDVSRRNLGRAAG